MEIRALYGSTISPVLERRESLISDGRNRYKSTHKIDYVKFSEDKLVCICGWEGWAYDRKDKDDDKHWPTHRDTAPSIDTKIDKLYKGNYGQKKNKKKVKVAA